MFSSTMKKAWLLLSTLMFAEYLIFIEEQLKLGVLANFISILMNVTLPAWFVYLLSRVKTNPESTYQNSDISIGVWGYFWRAYIIKWVSVIPTVFFVLFIFGNGVKPSATNYLITFISVGLFSIPLTWLLFSSFRKEQIKSISSKFVR